MLLLFPKTGTPSIDQTYITWYHLTVPHDKFFCVAWLPFSHCMANLRKNFTIPYKKFVLWYKVKCTSWPDNCYPADGAKNMLVLWSTRKSSTKTMQHLPMILISKWRWREQRFLFKDAIDEKQQGKTKRYLHPVLVLLIHSHSTTRHSSQQLVHSTRSLGSTSQQYTEHN